MYRASSAEQFPRFISSFILSAKNKATATLLAGLSCRYMMDKILLEFQVVQSYTGANA
jgi:hypothetical protein